MSNILQWSSEFLAGTQVMAIYWVLAICGTGLFLLTGILAMFGVGGVEADVDGDLDGDGIVGHPDSGFSDFRLVSMRSVLAFITVFGWGGVVWGRNGWIGFLAAFACGLAMMFITAAILFAVMKLQQSGNVKAMDFVGCSGIVYIGIPGGRAEPGKVTVTIGSATHEIQAVADDAVPTGTPVKVLELLGERRYLVKKN